MLFTILKNDFLKKKTITIIVLLFVFLATFLVSAATNMTESLQGALDNLFRSAQVPTFVQMQTGDVNVVAVKAWAGSQKNVQDYQIVKMINVDGSYIYFNGAKQSESQSVMSMDFVQQNSQFDFLLDLHGKIIHLLPGEIAVPIYFMHEKHLKLGDHVTIHAVNFTKTFTIAAFVRDALMNPSIIHSKRFVLSSADFENLMAHENALGQIQYLIEFQLFNIHDLKSFLETYQYSPLPKNGPTLGYPLFRMLNAVTDDIVIGIMIFFSVLLVVIALLCLRFIILSSLEEDYRQIGVMKGIGVPPSYICKMYLMKYIAMAGVGCGVGYVASLILNHLFVANILLYLGEGALSLHKTFVPLAAVFFIFLLVVSFCILVLRRFGKVSVISALQVASLRDQKFKTPFSTYFRKYMNLNLFLGIRDVVERFRLYILLLFIFFTAIFIIILPIHFLNTIQSPRFVTYMGVGLSDVRIDLQQGNASVRNIEKIVNYLKKDLDVSGFAVYTTSRFQALNPYHVAQNINIETGNFAAFPLPYFKGNAPVKTNEIALSYLNSQQLQKKVGDSLDVVVDGKVQPMKVSGIYQDVTNGGLTAKATLVSNNAPVLWYVINVNLKPAANVLAKIKEYNSSFSPARVTDIQEYLSQTLGDLIAQLKTIVELSLLVSVFIVCLIASLFLKMLVAKDYRSIAILKAIGFSEKQVRFQYITRVLVVLVLGVLTGTLFSNTVGQALVSLIWSFMGAPSISFVIKAWEVYFLCPCILILFVSTTACFSLSAVSKVNIANMLTE